MPWNWQLPHWPIFTYDREALASLEKEFLLNTGKALAFLKSVEEQERRDFVIEILSQEGLQSAKIEGELLDRESLQSSIKRHFGLQPDKKNASPKEAGMAQLLWAVYDSFHEPLSHEMLGTWHTMLFADDQTISDCGSYRTHSEPMQIVSARYDRPRIFFEAPPSSQMLQEMTSFLAWFNKQDSAILGKAALAHLYFESIHPFEDGNGRIGRALVEKMLSQAVGQPLLIALSQVLQKKKKNYYEALESCNRSLNAERFVNFFATSILEAQKESLKLIFFLIAKAKMLSSLAGQINARQEQALLRLFKEGPAGFAGGLSAKNYIAITKASQASTTRDLNDLVQKGALTKSGHLKHTRYFLACGNYFFGED